MFVARDLVLLAHGALSLSLSPPPSFPYPRVCIGHSPLPRCRGVLCGALGDLCRTVVLVLPSLFSSALVLRCCLRVFSPFQRATHHRKVPCGAKQGGVVAPPSMYHPGRMWHRATRTHAHHKTMRPVLWSCATAAAFSQTGLGSVAYVCVRVGPP